MYELDTTQLRRLNGPILITGHTGFKGVWLTMLLEDLGIEVVGLSLPPDKNSLYTQIKREGRVSEEFLDIRNFEKVNKFVHQVKPSAVFHLAAQPLVMDSYSEPRETFDVNVMGTVNLLDIAERLDSIKVFVSASTDKVYRNLNDGRKFNEADPLEGKDPYSASKVAAEAALHAWHNFPRIHKKEITNVVSVRAGNVIGGGDLSRNRLIPDLIRSVIDEQQTVIRNPASTRPWQHVIDPLLGYVKLLETMLGGKVFRAMNFSTGENSLSVSEVATLASKSWSKIDFVVEKNNLNSELVESASLDLDPSFAKSTIGWEAFWTQEQAIEKTVLWWKNVLDHKLSPEEACHKDICTVLDSVGR
jgi:CDP-glucose 4,6-dehydratase